MRFLRTRMLFWVASSALMVFQYCRSKSRRLIHFILARYPDVYACAWDGYEVTGITTTDHARKTLAKWDRKAFASDGSGKHTLETFMEQHRRKQA